VHLEVAEPEEAPMEEEDEGERGAVRSIDADRDFTIGAGDSAIFDVRDRRCIALERVACTGRPEPVEELSHGGFVIDARRGRCQIPELLQEGGGVGMKRHVHGLRHDDLASKLASRHGGEGVVDFVQPDCPAYERVEVEPAREVLVCVPGDVDTEAVGAHL
jgi:hypothetical protein